MISRAREVKTVKAGFCDQQRVTTKPFWTLNLDGSRSHLKSMVKDQWQRSQQKIRCDKRRASSQNWIQLRRRDSREAADASPSDHQTCRPMHDCVIVAALKVKASTNAQRNLSNWHAPLSTEHRRPKQFIGLHPGLSARRFSARSQV